MADNAIGQEEEIRGKVREGYAAIARAERTSCCGPSSCRGGQNADPAAALAQAVGYAESDLTDLPEGANMGLSCGNPVALASLCPGETALDLGSGGGFDVFIAGRRVGPTGRAIGVDMTPDMVSKARRGLATYRERTGLENVEFRLGEIEHLPVADDSVDAVISNCVLNLSPDKPQVWREIRRVLKPGGRVAVSDLALLRPLPESVASMIEALVGCIAGAALVEETEAMMRDAGLVDIQLDVRPDYVEAMTDWNDPLYRRVIEALPDGARASDYVVSLEARAHKPA